MKLLTPSQVKDARTAEQSREVLRIQELDKASATAHLKLAQVQAEFQATLARNLKVWEQEEKEHFERVKQKEEELVRLEECNRKTLIPFKAVQKKYDDKMREADERFARLEEREEFTADLTERLGDKLDAVGQREQAAKALEVALSFKQQGIEQQQALTKAGVVKLSETLASFTKQSQDKEQGFNKRQTALELREANQAATEERHKRTEKTLDDLAVVLKDERETLDRAWAELERKRLSP